MLDIIFNHAYYIVYEIPENLKHLLLYVFSLYCDLLWSEVEEGRGAAASEKPHLTSTEVWRWRPRAKTFKKLASSPILYEDVTQL